MADVTLREPETHAFSQDESTSPRFRLYRLCACSTCAGNGSIGKGTKRDPAQRCRDCRGEGRVRELVAECDTPEDIGVALVTLGREGEWAECPFGVLDTQGDVGKKWLVSPWLPSPRNVSDAGRVLARSKGKR